MSKRLAADLGHQVEQARKVKALEAENSRLRAELATVTKERDEATEILRNCCLAVGGFCGDDVSLGFLKRVPDEIVRRNANVNAKLAAADRERDEAELSQRVARTLSAHDEVKAAEARSELVFAKQERDAALKQANEADCAWQAIEESYGKIERRLAIAEKALETIAEERVLGEMMTPMNRARAALEAVRLGDRTDKP